MTGTTETTGAQAPDTSAQVEELAASLGHLVAIDDPDFFDWLDTIISDPNVSDSAVRVALVIIRHANERRKTDARPGAARVGTLIGKDERSIRKARVAVEKAGYLRVERASGKASTYKMRIPAGAEPRVKTPGVELANPGRKRPGTPGENARGPRAKTPTEQSEGTERKNRERGAAKRTPRPSRLPWPEGGVDPLDRHQQRAAERGVDLGSVLRKLEAWAKAQGTTSLDWHATLDAWIEREKPQDGRTGPQSQSATTVAAASGNNPPAPSNEAVAAPLEPTGNVTWDTVRESLRAELTPAVFASWFSTAELDSIADGVVWLSVGSPFLKDWIIKHYADRLKLAFDAAGVPDPVLRIKARRRAA